MSGDTTEKEGSGEHREEKTGRAVTRRGFMKTIGMAGAAAGLASVASRARAAKEGPAAKEKAAKGPKKKLKLTVAFSENPRVLPLKEGIVQPEHVELVFETIGATSLFFRNLS